MLRAHLHGGRGGGSVHTYVHTLEYALPPPFLFYAPNKKKQEVYVICIIYIYTRQTKGVRGEVGRYLYLYLYISETSIFV